MHRDIRDEFESIRRKAVRTFTANPLRYQHYAMGIRSDGAKVYAHNATRPEARLWYTHAEARLCQKLTANSTVFVLRLRSNSSLGKSCPCDSCLRLMARKGVKKVYYSMEGSDEFGFRYL